MDPHWLVPFYPCSIHSNTALVPSKDTTTDVGGNMEGYYRTASFTIIFPRLRWGYFHEHGQNLSGRCMDGLLGSTGRIHSL